MTSEERKIFSIFMPYAAKKQFAMQEKKCPLVHYTNAEAAMSIISNKQFWMRESACMNDLSEVRHGLKCIYGVYNSSIGAELRQTVAKIFPRAIVDLEQNFFNGWAHHFPQSTYLACFSEHNIDKENDLGRLSMWRAYSTAKCGVALVLNSDVFFEESDYFAGLYTSPVAYLNDAQFSEKFSEVVSNIKNNLGLLKELGEDSFRNFLFNTFMFASLCTKHPGFEEEREWRLTYCPLYKKCSNLDQTTVSVNGVPQIIYKIPLKNVPDHDIVGLDLDTLISRVIIGPSDYRGPLYKAFVDLLTKAGVSNAEKKVFISGVPLRQ